MMNEGMLPFLAAVGGLVLGAFVAGFMVGMIVLDAARARAARRQKRAPSISELMLERWRREWEERD